VASRGSPFLQLERFPENGVLLLTGFVGDTDTDIPDTNREEIMEKVIEILEMVITIIGDVKLSQAVSWLRVKENAESLRAEGHESDSQ
jgi:hypothetical protein